ncbi:5-deoxy-glucuronate isomerase [Nocardioides sp.]|uniref:5-deoxy-glucuronate isomerase n=1 Tax=Nocardioides sp. TaxID=35761 RepID=UPI0026050057|nr:5-deoxy-glucuronate isomerase [Nocardioides sp.]
MSAPARHLTSPGKVDPATAGWSYAGLEIVELAPGGSHTWPTEGAEWLVLPLAGAATVTVSPAHSDAVVPGPVVFDLIGRSGVFGPTTDVVYVPRDALATLTSVEGGRFALPSAQCTERLEARYSPASATEVELRGAGRCSRQVNNIVTESTFAAANLIVVEVLTPGGNWSSYPPHKHDQERPGEETALEEIYYYEVAGGGPAYQRVYGATDLTAEVRHGDVVTIPAGWHGPTMAAPGYDLYYLNVMAGPQRSWLICDDPDHTWIRETWADQEIDPRLPFTEHTQHTQHPQHPEEQR